MALLRVTVLVFDLREEIEQYSTVFLVLINRARSNRLRQSKHTKSTHQTTCCYCPFVTLLVVSNISLNPVDI